MANSWKQIPNLRTFERYYSKQDARKLIIFIKMLHEGFDAIVDARNRIGTFEGCTDIGLIYNTNLKNMLDNYTTEARPLTCGDVANLCLLNGDTGLIGWLPVTIGGRTMGQLCQIVSPNDRFRKSAITIASAQAQKKKASDAAVRAYDDAVEFFQAQTPGWQISKAGKDFKTKLQESRITIDANSWMINPDLVHTVWNPDIHPIIVQQLTNNVNNRAGNPLQFYSGGEYSLSKNLLPNFLLIPTQGAIATAGEIVEASLVNYSDGSNMRPTFCYDIEQHNAPLEIANWKPLAQTTLRALDEGGAYKSYGDQGNQLNVMSATSTVSATNNPTPYVVGNGQCCAVCSKIIAKKSASAADPGHWKDEPTFATASQSYDVDHILNLIFNTLLGLNDKSLGFLNTCGPCNRKFKGEKIWSPNYDLWQKLLLMADFIGSDDEGILTWPGMSLPGILGAKPFGGFRSYITGGGARPPGVKNPKLYESGCGMTSDSAKMNKNSSQISYLELQNVILDRLLQCMNQANDVLSKIMRSWNPLMTEHCGIEEVATILQSGISGLRKSYAKKVQIFPYVEREMQYTRALQNTIDSAQAKKAGTYSGESQDQISGSQSMMEKTMEEAGGHARAYRETGLETIRVNEQRQKQDLQGYVGKNVYTSPNSGKEKVKQGATPARGFSRTKIDFRQGTDINTRQNENQWLIPLIKLVVVDDVGRVSVSAENRVAFNSLIQEAVSKTSRATVEQLQHINNGHIATLEHGFQVAASLKKPYNQDYFDNYQILLRKDYVFTDLIAHINTECSKMPNPFFASRGDSAGAGSSISSDKCKTSQAVEVAKIQQQEIERDRVMEEAASNLFDQFLPENDDPQNAQTPPDSIVMGQIVDSVQQAGSRGIDVVQLFRKLRYEKKKIRKRKMKMVLHKAVRWDYLKKTGNTITLNIAKINAKNPWFPGRKLVNPRSKSVKPGSKKKRGGKRTRKKRRKRGKTKRKRKYRKKTKGRKRRRKKRTRRK